MKRKKRSPKKEKQIKKVRAIIYDTKSKKDYFLILHRILRWKGWETLKETMEKGETPEDAVKRGIKEETKLKKFKIIKRLNASEKWKALGNNYLIADSFLVKADMKQKISLKQEIIEHDNYKWVEKKEALRKLTWPKTKEMFENIEINGK